MRSVPSDAHETIARSWFTSRSAPGSGAGAPQAQATAGDATWSDTNSAATSDRPRFAEAISFS